MMYLPPEPRWTKSGHGQGGGCDGGSGNFAPGWRFGVIGREPRRMNSDPSDDGVSRREKPVLPPSIRDHNLPSPSPVQRKPAVMQEPVLVLNATRSEEHTSELQSRPHLVCRL